MPSPTVNGFVVGRSVTITIVTPAANLTIPTMTSSEAKARYAERESHDIKGNYKTIPIPAGWEGTIDLDMTDDTVDAFIDSMESGYYQGQGITSSTITDSRTYSNGTVAQYLFTGVMFTLSEGGTFKGDDKVTQRLAWKASKRARTT